MHELSLVINALNMVTRDASRRGLTKITRVDLEVGELSGAYPHALKEAFPIASKGSMAEGAEFIVAEIPATMCCKTCSTSFSPLVSGWQCPSCGSGDIALTRGMELQVVSYIGEEGPDEHQGSDRKGTS